MFGTREEGLSKTTQGRRTRNKNTSTGCRRRSQKPCQSRSTPHNDIVECLLVSLRFQFYLFNHRYKFAKNAARARHLFMEMEVMQDRTDRAKSPSSSPLVNTHPGFRSADGGNTRPTSQENRTQYSMLGLLSNSSLL